MDSSSHPTNGGDGGRWDLLGIDDDGDDDDDRVGR